MPAASSSKIGIGETGEAQTAFDEPAGDTEAQGNRFDIAIFRREMLECAAFLGGRHGHALKVLGQRCFGAIAGFAVEYLAGNLGIGFPALAIDDLVHGAQAAATGDHVEMPALLGLGNDQVL